ncbi:ATP-grasp domain-containing protein [Gemmata sp. G18]|uniref:ATP-grasp domain-containing protein n=1 Tax=Gemmata palustris TaxID=2822762 RepID=A0ABS5BUK6_9BACT|nr:ATP-grasp domain-containing protein [Gemmata palustris]MBP3957356.1 ATP-grasp domain-containing protein [Gemmata palustris]
MPTLIVAARSFVCSVGGTPPLSAVYDQRVIAAAESIGWSVLGAADDWISDDVPDPVVYVTTELAMSTACSLDLALLEPSFDLLTRVPERFLRRHVESATFGDLDRLDGRTFVKPADPLDKWFDAGLYSDVRDIRTCGRSRPEAPILLSEPVEWSVEFRYFVLEGKAVAGSPYLAYGRPAWRWSATASPIPTAGLHVVEGLCAAMEGELPPAFVVDVGRIDDRGWAVVEFNPVWSAGLLNADARAVLPVLQRATRPRPISHASDQRWDLRGG